MGHGGEVYISGGMMELGDFGAAGGLDKIGVVAPVMVQFASVAWTPKNRREPIPAWNALLPRLPGHPQELGQALVAFYVVGDGFACRAGGVAPQSYLW